MARLLPRSKDRKYKRRRFISSLNGIVSHNAHCRGVSSLRYLAVRKSFIKKCNWDPLYNDFGLLNPTTIGFRHNWTLKLTSIPFKSALWKAIYFCTPSLKSLVLRSKGCAEEIAIPTTSTSRSAAYIAVSILPKI